MLNPKKTLHKLLGMMLFRLPHNQRKWQVCLAQYRPILENAFKYNYAARLLVMKALGQIRRKDIDGAQNTLQVIKQIAADGESLEKALWAFLHGLSYMQANNRKQAIRYFKSANKLQHRLFLPYLITADYYLSEHIDYPKAVSDFRTAIDCIYEYPPLNETTRQALCAAHADLCFCHVMMHQYDEARDDFLHAEQMASDKSSTLYASIYLHAALRDEQETAELLPKYQGFCQEALKEFDAFKARIERILADEDPHFTQLPIGSPEGIDAFWQNFLAHEDEMMQLLRDNRPLDARKLMAGPLQEMDPYEIDVWGFDVLMRNAAYTIFFRANYSRTYTPLIDAIIAACPPEIRQRWRIIREP